MITRGKVTDIFCIIDEFDKKLDFELKKNIFQSLMEENVIGKHRCRIVK